MAINYRKCNGDRKKQ